jgi:hypothetical protein
VQSPGRCLHYRVIITQASKNAAAISLDGFPISFKAATALLRSLHQDRATPPLLFVRSKTLLSIEQSYIASVSVLGSKSMQAVAAYGVFGPCMVTSEGSQFSPAGKEALDCVKNFIREASSCGAINERALCLGGFRRTHPNAAGLLS